MRTFIKWSGNKSKHVNKIINYLPSQYDTYIEPFVGSGAMLLKIEPKKWVINDVNKDLINVWKTVKNNHDEIIRGFKVFGAKFEKLNRGEKVRICRVITSSIEKMTFDAKRAILFLLMKSCAYMGNIIVNNKFYFNGLDLKLYNNDNAFLKEDNYKNICEVSKYLNDTNGKIYNEDYKTILETAKRNDFVFLDPPYVEEHDYRFNYNKDEKLDNMFVAELKRELKKLDQRGVKWLMTQANTTHIRESFKEYRINTFDVYRATSKMYKKELIIMNYTEGST